MKQTNPNDFLSIYKQLTEKASSATEICGVCLGPCLVLT